MASLFVACSQSAEQDEAAQEEAIQPEAEATDEWQPEMYEVSELVKVMRNIE